MKTLQELHTHLSSLPNTPHDYKIAVASLIFTPEDKVILIERGSLARDSHGKLEGVGGSLQKGETNLHTALYREIREEIGHVEVSIEKMLEVKIIKENEINWIIVDYLCRLISGIPTIMEPEKCVAIHLLRLPEIDSNKLSIFQQSAMESYRNQYGDKPFYLR